MKNQYLKESIKSGAIFFSGMYGSTEQYAQWIGEATELPVFDIKDTHADPSKYISTSRRSKVTVSLLLVH